MEFDGGTQGILRQTPTRRPAGARQGPPRCLGAAISCKPPPRSGRTQIVDLARASALLRGAGGVRAGVGQHPSHVDGHAVTAGPNQVAL